MTREIFFHYNYIGEIAGLIIAGLMLLIMLYSKPKDTFVYKYIFNGNSFTMDTREFREILGDVPFDNKEVSDYIKEYLSENKYNTDNGKNI